MENNKTIIIKKQKSQENIANSSDSSFHLSDVLVNIPKNSNQFLRKKELFEYAEEKKNEKSLLYPTLNDPLFSEKIAIQKEFANIPLPQLKEDVNKEFYELSLAHYQRYIQPNFFT